jgi:hypothetical protein
MRPSAPTARPCWAAAAWFAALAPSCPTLKIADQIERKANASALLAANLCRRQRGERRLTLRKTMTAVAAAASLLAPLLGAEAAAAQVPSTKVSTYKPWAENSRSLKVRSGYKVVKRVHGECWTGSSVAYHREDAWRCMVNNLIYDPCFVDMTVGDPSNPVLCPVSPGSKHVIKISQGYLPLDYMNHPGSAKVWALVLSNKVRCETPTGAVGRPMKFLCSNGSRFVSSWKHSGRVWTVRLASVKSPKSVKTVRVVKAFR